MAVEALATVGASPAGADTRQDDPVTDGQSGDPLADLGDHADALVTQDAADLDLRNIAVEDMEVGSADRGGDHLDDDISRLFDLRIGYFVPCLLAGTFVDECFHDGPPTVHFRHRVPARWRVGQALPLRLRTAETAD